MKGRLRKTRQNKSAEGIIKGTASPITAEESSVAPGSDLVTKQVEDANLTSTPVRGSSTDPLSCSSKSPQKAKVQIKFTEFISQSEASEKESLSSNLKCQGRRKRGQSLKPRQIRQRAAKKQRQADCPKPKRQSGRKWVTQTSNVKGETTTLSPKRLRPRFELEKLSAAEQEEDSLLSSDLSIELSQHEEQLPSLSIQEVEKSDEDDEEELPSYLTEMDKKPLGIKDGAFVWCKFRNYPFWPAWVKSVNRKHKKASVMFVDGIGFQQRKGLTVALKPLKPFDCDEADELIKEAKKMFDATISWALALIEDYRIRIACGSFSGSFIEYLNHDMSYPVRRTCPQAALEGLSIISDTMTEEPWDDKNKKEEDGKSQEDSSQSSKRLLPDRTHAAHNRANEKLVHFIVNQRMVEQHLLAIIRGQQQSRWLRSFLNNKRKREVNIYLEDDRQLDKVYWYLNELCATSKGSTTPRLPKVKSVENVPYVLHVLLPEAIIYAIAGVDNVSLEKAEEKYLRGRCISNRERQEFDRMIEQQMRRKSEHKNTELELFSDPVT